MMNSTSLTRVLDCDWMRGWRVRVAGQIGTVGQIPGTQQLALTGAAQLGSGGSLLGGDVWRGSAWHVLLRSCALVGRVQALQKELVVALRVCRDTRSHLQVARHCNTESVLELFGFYRRKCNNATVLKCLGIPHFYI